MLAVRTFDHVLDGLVQVHPIETGNSRVNAAATRCKLLSVPKVDEDAATIHRDASFENGLKR